MKKLTLYLSEEIDEKELKMVVAAILFDKGILLSGQAGDFAGMTKREFLESVGKYGVSIFGEKLEDITKII